VEEENEDLTMAVMRIAPTEVEAEALMTAVEAEAPMTVVEAEAPMTVAAAGARAIMKTVPTEQTENDPTMLKARSPGTNTEEEDIRAVVHTEVIAADLTKSEKNVTDTNQRPKKITLRKAATTVEDNPTEVGPKKQVEEARGLTSTTENKDTKAEETDRSLEVATEADHITLIELRKTNATKKMTVSKEPGAMEEAIGARTGATVAADLTEAVKDAENAGTEEALEDSEAAKVAMATENAKTTEPGREAATRGSSIREILFLVAATMSDAAAGTTKITAHHEPPMLKLILRPRLSGEAHEAAEGAAAP